MESRADEVDVAVIGAGVVGLAVAAELSRKRSVVVLERHESYGRENSSHNSGVLHAGIYYPPDWLKTRLCIEGNGLLYEWAEHHGVRVQRIGKLIVALEDAERPALEQLLDAARANGVPDLEPLTARDIEEREPSIHAVAGIYSASSGVIDQMQLMRSFMAAAEANAVMMAFKHAVASVERDGGSFLLGVDDASGERIVLRALLLVNAAGLGADRIAAMLGYPLDGGSVAGSETNVPRLRQTVNAGRYYDIVNRAKASQLRHLIYPLPLADRSGLGVHVTLDVDGGVHLGPDTEWFAASDPLDYVHVIDDERRLRFLESARRFLPWLESDDILPGQVGYRTKLHDPGEGPCDFLVWHDRGYVHLGGIESPGMTASPALARHVVALV